MGKKSKWRKGISIAFKDLTDEEILDMTYQVVTEYTKVIKAEKKATEILDKYKVSTYSVNSTEERLKFNYTVMLECANIRNLIIPSEWYEVDYSVEKVIDILEHVKFNRLSWFDNDDCYDERVAIAKSKICLFFANIYQEEFGIGSIDRENNGFAFKESIFNTDVRTLKRTKKNALSCI